MYSLKWFQKRLKGPELLVLGYPASISYLNWNQLGTQYPVLHRRKSREAVKFFGLANITSISLEREPWHRTETMMLKKEKPASRLKEASRVNMTFQFLIR